MGRPPKYIPEFRRDEAGVSERYELMAAERTKFPVRLMARLLGVSPSGFYSWASSHAGSEPPADPWGQLRAEAMRLWLDSGCRWGTRTVFSQVADRFPGAILYRVRRCMRELWIRGACPLRRVRTTVPDLAVPARPNLIRRDFASPVPTRLVGWYMMERMTADIAVFALEMARGRNAIFHSDRGSQYTSAPRPAGPRPTT